MKPSMALRIEQTRNELCESVHRVHVAVVDANGRRVAESGDPARVTFLRSSAKPFQALPIVLDGAADHFGLDPSMLALCCASHSSEPVHVDGVERILARIGCTEADLACGPHPPMNIAVARRFVREGTEPTPIYSNCSGKHAGMLALARFHGWPTQGYEKTGHPVQERILAEVCRLTDLPRTAIHLGVDGCTVVCFAMPLTAMALAYARWGAATAVGEKRIREAMWAHPYLVAGEHRLCTDLMTAAPGEILAKVGAEGVYGAALPRFALGIALKVEDGDGASASIALMAVVREVLERLDPAFLTALPMDRLAPHARSDIKTTRGVVVGERRAMGGLSFVAA